MMEEIVAETMSIPNTAQFAHAWTLMQQPQLLHQHLLPQALALAQVLHLPHLLLEAAPQCLLSWAETESLVEKRLQVLHQHPQLMDVDHPNGKATIFAMMKTTNTKPLDMSVLPMLEYCAFPNSTLAPLMKNCPASYQQLKLLLMKWVIIWVCGTILMMFMEDKEDHVTVKDS